MGYSILHATFFCKVRNSPSVSGGHLWIQAIGSSKLFLILMLINALNQLKRIPYSKYQKFCWPKSIGPLCVNIPGLHSPGNAIFDILSLHVGSLPHINFATSVSRWWVFFGHTPLRVAVYESEVQSAVGHASTVLCFQFTISLP